MLGEDGLIVTAAMDGAEFPMVMVSLTGEPSSEPSEGVTVQVTSSPRENPLLRVLPDPASVPSIVHRMIDASAPPSAS